LLSDKAAGLALAHGINELEADILTLLFSSLNSGVVISFIGSLELAPSNAALALLIK